MRRSIAFLLGGMTVATASTIAAPAQCESKDSSAELALVLCDKGTGQAALKAAGQAACKGKTVCNAWIWEDASKMPAKAPASGKDLPKTATGAARAVWIQDSQSLIELRKAP